jgi:gluconolactonase
MRVIASDLEFPEGPVALPDGSVLVVEIRRQTLTRVHGDGTKSIIAKLPGGPNGAALGPDGKVYICNNGGTGSEYIGGSIQRVDLQSGRVELLSDRCGEFPLNGPNDLVFDRQGGLWFTDFGKLRTRDLDYGGVYYISPSATQIREITFPMLQPNGIGLSPDESRLYVTETATARLWSFDVPAPGEIQRVSAPIRGEAGTCVAGMGGYRMFDSFALEACGNICIATMLTGEITVLSPQGEIVDCISFGDPRITNIAFGGPDLKTAYITLGHKGQLVAMEWPRPGLPLNYLNV